MKKNVTRANELRSQANREKMLAMLQKRKKAEEKLDEWSSKNRNDAGLDAYYQRKKLQRAFSEDSGWRKVFNFFHQGWDTPQFPKTGADVRNYEFVVRQLTDVIGDGKKRKYTKQKKASRFAEQRDIMKRMNTPKRTMTLTKKNSNRDT